MKVKDIGEQGLLERLQRFCPTEIIGDDAAVITTSPEKSLVVTTDMLVDGVHFSDATTNPEDVGWRSAAANLSDLAAMGATPLGITVALGLPGEVSVEWVERLYKGMDECLKLHQTPIVGGDVCRSPVITVAITAFGEVEPNQTIYRHTAQVGDAIAITGFHGASRAGLELLLHPEIGQNLSDRDRAFLIQAHQRPKPRLDVLPILQEILAGDVGKAKRAFNSEFRIPNSEFPISGMDSSDGLADAIVQICAMSNVGARIDRDRIPIPPALSNLVTAEQAVEWALYGGEDFELVLCLPQQLAEAPIEHLGEGAAIIGEITAESAIILGDRTNKNPDRILSRDRGFQHF
ncbi:thiamine-phosphate kinase [Scytonema millei]|uniref:thiamine-phosphate kinase n=1 Tax=Scytonema millei TaxID=1245922 RepID=UPI000ABECF40|nr:thiamine-phosphate kinase [Scytonema millei]